MSAQEYRVVLYEELARLRDSLGAAKNPDAALEARVDLLADAMLRWIEIVGQMPVDRRRRQG